VLSPGTERQDKLEKRLAYELIPALHTYILVSQDCRQLVVHRRSGDAWKREVLPDDGALLLLPELDFSLSLDAIYARTGL
jgi:Uma2 family endonuclease